MRQVTRVGIEQASCWAMTRQAQNTENVHSRNQMGLQINQPAPSSSGLAVEAILIFLLPW